MPDAPAPRSPGQAPTFADQIGAKAARKLQARKVEARSAKRSAWSGLGAMGVIGWSLTMPTVLGAALGLWLDKHHGSTHSWTPALLLVGLVVGCLNAWRWVSERDKEMHRKEGDGDG
jgi:ATP synthase protein I